MIIASRLFFIAFAVLSAFSPMRLLAQAPAQLNQWAGESLGPKDGAFFVYFQTVSRQQSESEKLDSDVTLTMTNLVTKRNYQFSQAIGKTPIPVIWRLPAGKYVVRSLRTVGSDGKEYTAKFEKKAGKRFIVKNLYISNLVTWIIFTASGKLEIGIKKSKNAYSPKDPSTLSTFKGIISGLSGKLELEFPNPNPDSEKETKTEQSAPNQLRKTLSSTRSIAMFFRLNLFKNNTYAPMIAAAIASADQKLRMCYSDALDRKGDLRGEVVLRFAISQESASFKKLAVSKSSIPDPELEECLIQQMSQLQLPALKSMLGELVFNFDYSD